MNRAEKEQSLLLAGHYLQSGSYSLAQELLKKIIAIDVRNSKAHELLAYVYGSQGHSDLALKHLQMACAEQECSTEALYHLGSLQLQSGLYELAVDSLRRCITNAGEFFEVLHDLGMAYGQLGQPLNALECFEKCLKLELNSCELFFNTGKIYDELGRFDEALIAYEKAIQLSPEFIQAWSNKGVALKELNRFEEALTAYDKALQIDPAYVVAWVNKANVLKDLGRPEEALSSYDHALTIDSQYAPAWYNKAIILCELLNHEQALVCFEQAIHLAPQYIQAWSGMGVLFDTLNRQDEALKHFDKALELSPHYAEAWLGKGVSLNHQFRFQDAIECFDRAIALSPKLVEAWSNKGVALRELQRYEEALQAYDNAIGLQPDFAQAWSNKGVALLNLRRFEAALEHFDKALEYKPNFQASLLNKAAALHELKRYEEALEIYEQIIALDSTIDFVIGDRLQTQMEMGNWTNLDAAISACAQGITDAQCVIHPFPLLGVIDDPKLHQQCAQAYIKVKHPGAATKAIFDDHDASQKIKLGYFSSDFREHAVSQLIVQLFEKHDRNRFELHGFSFGPPSSDGLRDRIIKACDQFHEVVHLSDAEVCRLARAHGIDIAINLNGHTQFARTGIFANRAAPIQVNYLGYPGTMGAPYMDYIIGDKVVISTGMERDFSEKIVYLPHCYLVNDSSKPISDKSFTRLEMGLPKDAFVFCSFNNSYKITPEIFDVWMQILRSVENSVLWLRDTNPIAMQNLKTEAVKRGVEEGRLIFAPRMPSLDEHLSRHRLADLFLDTLPYNAHTTASDALWSGLPVLTCMGQSFASRVAASLLSSIHLPELITHSLQDYSERAIELAKNPDQLNRIRQKLLNNRLTTPLFNTSMYTQDLERAYEAMVAQHRAGLMPEAISISM